jgi:hypothetical protein
MQSLLCLQYVLNISLLGADDFSRSSNTGLVYHGIFVVLHFFFFSPVAFSPCAIPLLESAKVRRCIAREWWPKKRERTGGESGFRHRIGGKRELARFDAIYFWGMQKRCTTQIQTKKEGKMQRLLCCILYIIVVGPMLLAYLICAILAAIFGHPEKCQPIMDQLNKLAACCSGKK